jgi:hypothetical protein
VITTPAPNNVPEAIFIPLLKTAFTPKKQLDSTMQLPETTTRGARKLWDFMIL